MLVQLTSLAAAPYSSPAEAFVALRVCDTTLACAGPKGVSVEPSTVAGPLGVSSSNSTNFAGSPTPYSVSSPSGVDLKSVSWSFGDGTESQGSGLSADHTYQNPGIYLVYANASSTNGSSYSNVKSLLRHSDVASAINDSLGNLASVAGEIVGNTTSNVNASAVVSQGGSVSVSNWIERGPTNPEWTLGTPTYSIQPTAGVSFSGSLINLSGLNGVTVGFSPRATNGSYALTFSVPSSSDVQGSVETVWSNFTFTVFVGEGAGVSTPAVPVSPHSGTLVVYSNGSYVTEDPQVSYDGPDFGLLQNVYQSLLFPNVTQPGPDPDDYVPDLATCVPETQLCSTLYGSYAAGFETDDSYTFVLNPAATFYDPSTGAHSTVWPNDVAFSVARDCLTAEDYQGYYGPGWILCQALIPGGSTPGPLRANASWDGGLHGYFNNTPANILQALVVNDSAVCPSTSPMRDGVAGDGCITFYTNETQTAWPEFLSLITGDSGDWIGSCDWFVSLGLGLPGWTDGTSCYPSPPGSAGNPSPVPSETAWDAYILNIVNNWTGSPARWTASGSGPYYLKSLEISDGNLTSYELAPNPYWGGTTCVGGTLAGCLPAAPVGAGGPAYIPNVTVYNELTVGTSEGLNALRSGQADLIDLDSTDIDAATQAMSSGDLSIASIPSYTINFFSLALNYSVSAAAEIMGSTPTLPATLLQNLDVREFLVHSFPDQTQNQEGCILSGVQFCFQYGGVIPEGMTGYYPTNISWQFTDPVANPEVVGSAGWWWAQVENDPNVTAYCQSSHPCTFPLPDPAWGGTTVGGVYSNPGVAESLWASEIISLSGGALDPIVVSVDQSEFDEVAEGPGENPFPIYTYIFSWAPDYPDPSDYTQSADSFYGAIDGLTPGLLVPQYMKACAGPAQDPVVTTSCQGTAYQELLTLNAEGNSCAPPSCSSAQRALYYEMVDQISTSLGLYVPRGQLDVVAAIAPWIDPTSIVNDPEFGSAATIESQPFFDVRYLSVVPPLYPLTVGPPGAAGGNPSAQRLSPETAFTTVPPLETGESILFLVSATGGTGVYHYVWDGLPAGCASADSAAITCTPTGTGTVSLQVQVSDSRGDQGSSPIVPLTVVQGPDITSFSASPDPVTVGHVTTLTVVAVGGIGGLVLSYAGLPPGCTGGNTSTLVCTPAATGSFTIVAFATDSIGVVSLANTTLVTQSAPGPGAPFPWGLIEASGLGLTVGVVAATSTAWWFWKRGRPPHDEQPSVP